MKRSRDYDQTNLEQPASQKPRVDQLPQLDAEARQVRLSKLQRQIAHEFKADFGKKAREALSETMDQQKLAEASLDTAVKRQQQGMPADVEQAKRTLEEAKAMHERYRQFAEQAELTDLHEMMDKVRLLRGVSVIGALRAGEERAVRTTDRDTMRCFSCGNEDQGCFRTRHETGDTVCTKCGVVQSQRNAFDGDWTRSFEGDDDKSQTGAAPSHLHSASYNLRTSLGGTEGVSNEVLKTLQRVQKTIDDDYTHGAVKGERRTKDSTKDRQKERAFDSIKQVADKLALPERVVATACNLFAQFRDNRENLHAYENVLTACLSAALEDMQQAYTRQQQAVVELKAPAGGAGAGTSGGAGGYTGGGLIASSSGSSASASASASASGASGQQGPGDGAVAAAAASSAPSSNSENADDEFVVSVEGGAQDGAAQSPVGPVGSNAIQSQMLPRSTGVVSSQHVAGETSPSSSAASVTATAPAPSRHIVVIRSEAGPKSEAERAQLELKRRRFEADLRRRTAAVAKTTFVSIGTALGAGSSRTGRGVGLGRGRGRGRGSAGRSMPGKSLSRGLGGVTGQYGLIGSSRRAAVGASSSSSSSRSAGSKASKGTVASGSKAGKQDGKE